MQSMKKRQFGEISAFECVKKSIATEYFKEIWCSSNNIQKQQNTERKEIAESMSKEVIMKKPSSHLKPIEQFAGIINSLFIIKENSEKIETNDICMKSHLSVSTLTKSGYKPKVPYKVGPVNNGNYLGFMEYKSTENSKDILEEKISPKQKPRKMKEIMELYTCVYCDTMRVQQIIVPVDEEEQFNNVAKNKMLDDSIDESNPSDCLSEKSEISMEDKSALDLSLDSLSGIEESLTKPSEDEKNYLFSATLSNYLEGKSDSEKIHNPFVCQTCTEKGLIVVCRMPECLNPISKAMLCREHVSKTGCLTAMTRLERDAFLRKIQKKCNVSNPKVRVSRIHKENVENIEKRCV